MQKHQGGKKGSTTWLDSVSNQKALKEIAMNYEGNDLIRIRTAALRKLDQDTLSQVAIECDPTPDSYIHFKRSLKEIRQTESWHFGLETIALIQNQGYLAAVAQKSRSALVQEAAIDKLEDQPTLAAISRNGTAYITRVRIAAVEKLNNQELLEVIALSKTEDFRVRCAAMPHLQNQEIRNQIASDSTERNDVRGAALEGVSDIKILEDAGLYSFDGNTPLQPIVIKRMAKLLRTRDTQE
jgi:hypothetical protein